MKKNSEFLNYSILAQCFFIIAALMTLGLQACQIAEGSNEPLPVTIQSPKLGMLINIGNRRLENLRAYDKKLFMVDLRQPEELTGEYPMLEGAVNIQDSIIFENPDILPKGKTIVLICRSGRRSAAIGKWLIGLGINVFNLEKGLKGYYQKGGKGNLSSTVTKEEWESERGC